MLNYHDFINDFQNTVISLDLCKESEGDEASGDNQEISFEKKTMDDISADDSKQIIYAFKNSYFLKLYRYDILMLLPFNPLNANI